jgi:Glycosyltransferase family 92
MSGTAYLAACAIFKDEAPYLAEWIEFHRLIGVERFFLYDNSSGDTSRVVLAPWVRAGVVQVTDASIPLAAGGQRVAYADGLERARGRVRWLAFIDIDEFLFSPQRESLAQILPEYERHPGVVVNWQVYGSSGLLTIPPGLVVESFVARARTDWIRNRRVKSIVDPVRALRPSGPHFFEYAGGALAVTENHEPVRAVDVRASARQLKRGLARLPLLHTDPYAVRNSSVKRVSIRRLRINHYAVKSRQEFLDKVARHAPRGSDAHDSRTRVASRYFHYHDRNEVHDAVLAEYGQKVRSRLTT